MESGGTTGLVSRCTTFRARVILAFRGRQQKIDGSDGSLEGGNIYIFDLGSEDMRVGEIGRIRGSSYRVGINGSNERCTSRSGTGAAASRTAEEVESTHYSYSAQ